MCRVTEQIKTEFAPKELQTAALEDCNHRSPDAASDIDVATTAIESALSSDNYCQSHSSSPYDGQCITSQEDHKTMETALASAERGLCGSVST